MENKLKLISPEAAISVRWQSAFLGVPRSNLYYRRKIEFSQEDLEMMRLMDEWHTKDSTFGFRRHHQNLLREGFCVGRDRVRKFMKAMDIKAIYQKPKTSIPNKENKIYPYLLRDLKIMYPNQVWAIDITYVPMLHGFCYLVAIIDWYSRYILAWELSNSLSKEFCVSALEKALSKYGIPLIMNSDQGSQFTSNAFTKILLDCSVDISMDSVGRWIDNVVIERWFRTYKYEHLYLKDYAKITEINGGTGEYIEYYNFDRIHASLNYNTPYEVYFGHN